MTAELRAAATDEAASPPAWQGRSLLAGLFGAFVASFCCLPAAAAVALGLSTAVALSGLLAYQRAFQVAGLAIALGAVWWIVRRGSGQCQLSPRQRDRVWLLVCGAFAAGFLVLNLVVIPLLYRLPWLLAGQ